ncbi:MAG: type IVB secretion system coupling complex protein DotM/IcmP [Legionella sp.]|nr:type IVB secretion system coupling complex protein DotM/IcmP [Legionella sp.]
MAKQAQQQGGGGGSGDNSLALLWVMALFFVTAFIVWYFEHTYIVAFVFYLNILQVKLISFFMTDMRLKEAMAFMTHMDPSSVTWDQLVEVTNAIGEYVRYPVIGLFFIFAIVLYRTDLIMRFRKSYDMQRLRSQEQHNWQAIMPVIKEDLVKADINQGPWAMALTPIEFARKYRLLRKAENLDKAFIGSEMTASIHKGDAKRVFTLQLGPYWDGFEHCSPQAAALAAIFISRINRDRESAKRILESIDQSYAQGKPNFSVAKATLNKYKNTPEVQEIVAKHAYMLTVMASLLEASRADGVVPTAEFLWLKPTDRRLWYMLNSVGRQTPFAEVGGAFAHWRAEKVTGRRLVTPMIDEAIKALEMAVKEVKLTVKELQELEP